MNAADVITALGGPAAVSRLFGVRSNAVSNWKRRGFPKSRWHEIWLECQWAGIRYDPADPKINVRDTTHGGTSSTRLSNEKTSIEDPHGKQIIKEYDKKVTEEDSPKTLGNSVAPDGTIVGSSDGSAAA